MEQYLCQDFCQQVLQKCAVGIFVMHISRIFYRYSISNSEVAESFSEIPPEV